MSKQRIKPKVILIGYKSFLQQNAYLYFSKKKYSVKKLKYTNTKNYKFKNNDIIVNFSNHKKFYYGDYSKSIDRNYNLAKKVEKSGSTFVLISTRQIYEPKMNIKETSRIKPLNNYAKNCLKSEIKCKQILKNNLLIIRLSNIIGLEKGKKKKSSLMSLIIAGIENRKILFDNNYYLYKDLLPVELFCVFLEKLIFLNFKGVINLGSGIPVKINFFLDNIIKNNKIKIEIKLKRKFKDKNFCFNTSYLNKITNIKITKKNLFIYFKRLKKELEKIR